MSRVRSATTLQAHGNTLGFPGTRLLPDHLPKRGCRLAKVAIRRATADVDRAESPNCLRTAKKCLPLSANLRNCFVGKSGAKIAVEAVGKERSGNVEMVVKNLLH